MPVIHFKVVIDPWGLDIAKNFIGWIETVYIQKFEEMKFHSVIGHLYIEIYQITTA